MLHYAVDENNIKALKVILSHPRLTALALNQKYKRYAASPVMFAVYMNRSEILTLLADDPRVDLETTDWKGRSLEEVAENMDPEIFPFVAEVVNNILDPVKSLFNTICRCSIMLSAVSTRGERIVF